MNSDMVEPMAHSSHAACDLNGRWPKAEKIRRLLPLAGNEGRKLRLLEVGTGSGAIAHYFSQISAPEFHVSAVDVEDQRSIDTGYEFKIYDGQHLPFDAQSFDIVISNHVIEHVGDREHQAHHLLELSRVLAPGGYIYLATPSRWQLVEPHFSLPFLSWIPRGWRDSYVRLAGKGEMYDCDLLRPVELRRLFEAAALSYRNLNVQALRAFADIERPGSVLLKLATLLPGWALKRMANLFPTLIFLVYRPSVRVAPNAVQSGAPSLPNGTRS